MQKEVIEIKNKEHVPRRQTIGLSLNLDGGILMATQQYIFANWSFFFIDKVIYMYILPYTVKNRV